MSPIQIKCYRIFLGGFAFYSDRTEENERWGGERREMIVRPCWVIPALFYSKDTHLPSFVVHSQCHGPPRFGWLPWACGGFEMAGWIGGVCFWQWIPGRGHRHVSDSLCAHCSSGGAIVCFAGAPAAFRHKQSCISKPKMGWIHTWLNPHSKKLSHFVGTFSAPLSTHPSTPFCLFLLQFSVTFCLESLFCSLMPIDL